LFLMTAFSRLGIEPIRFWSVDRNWFPCFSETALQCLQWLRLGVGINGCCHNAPNVLNWRQIRRIRRPILRRNVVFNICIQPGDCTPLMYAHERHPAETFLHGCGKKLFCSNISASLHVACINQLSNERLWYFAHKIDLNFPERW